MLYISFFNKIKQKQGGLSRELRKESDSADAGSGTRHPIAIAFFRSESVSFWFFDSWAHFQYKTQNHVTITRLEFGLLPSHSHLLLPTAVLLHLRASASQPRISRFHSSTNILL